MIMIIKGSTVPMWRGIAAANAYIPNGDGTFTPGVGGG